MKIIILLFTLIITSTLGISQSDYLNWSNSDIIVPLRINFVIIQKNDSTSNFGNNEETKLYFKQITDQVNKLYRSLKDTKDPSCYDGSSPFKTKLNVKYTNKLTFIQNSKYWDNKGSVYGYFCPNERNWFLKRLSDSLNNLETARAINIFLTEDGDHFNNLITNKNTTDFTASGGACSEYPSKTDWNKAMSIHYPNQYSVYWYLKNIVSNSAKDWETKRADKIKIFAKGLAHELGHSLGLAHNNKYHGTNQCWHSIMHQGGDSPKDYLQPTEIAKVNYNLNHTTLTSFVDSNFIIESPLIIDSLLTVESKCRIYQSVDIKKGETLVVKSTLYIPKNAKVQIRKNGHLIIEKEGEIIHLDKRRPKIIYSKKSSYSNQSNFIYTKSKRCFF